MDRQTLAFRVEHRYGHETRAGRAKLVETLCRTFRNRSIYLKMRSNESKIWRHDKEFRKILVASYNFILVCIPVGQAVGLRALDDAAIEVDETRAAIGADHFVSSFEDVLQYCQTVTVSGPTPDNYRPMKVL